MIYDNIAVLGNMACKFAEALFNILNTGEEVKVILLNIEYNGNGRLKRQKRVIILTRLHNDGVARSDSVPCLKKRQSSAYHDGGVLFGRHKDMSTH